MISVSQNVFMVDHLHKAYLKCRKGKRGAIHTRGFETKLFAELQGLSESLVNGSYRPSRSVCFYVTKPKLREIFAAHFRDRVVHRLVVDILEPVYEKKFIQDSYACRVGKGTHKAVERLKEFVHRGTKKSKSHFYYLQLDIKGFFMEIHKPTFLNILSKTISKGVLYDLCAVIVNHNPAKHFIYKGRIPKKGLLPPHKTLFHEDIEKGIPIGNLTSQFFANVYLNELDQYIKRGLGAKYYIRYVDDFILLHEEPEQLLEWKEKIIQYLKEKLNLTLKEEKVEPRSVYKGIDFLGYFIKPRYTLVRRRVLKNYENVIREYLPVSFQLEHPFYRKQYISDLHYYKKFQSRVNSYLAHFQHADSFKLRQDLEKKIKEYQYAMILQKDYIRIPRSLSRFSKFRYQIRYYLKQFPNHLLIVQIGKYYELYGEGFAEVSKHFQLKPKYRGSLFTFGFPVKKTKYAKNWLRQIVSYCNKSYTSYVLFTQSDEIVENMKIRMPIFRQTQIHPIQLELFDNSKIFLKQNKRRNKNDSK
jgi:retron-type reverse transcriptase